MRSRGGIVHWARDGAEANAIVAGIARDHGADEVIKVKSLATDEIGLNEALELPRDRGDRDRPGRADRAARRRRAVAHPRPRDPPQPRRDRGACSSARSPRARSSGSSRARSPRPPGATCARSSSPRARGRRARRLGGAARGGRRVKARAMATLPALLEQLEERVTAAGGTVHWARDGAEANAIIAGIARAHGADEVIKVKSLATDEIGLNEALATARHPGDRDRPRRADRAARRRRAVAHPRPRDPPQPRRDRRAVRADDRRRAGPRARAARDRRGGPPAPAREVPLASPSRSAARTSRSPRPARSASSSPRATAACARRCRRSSSR